MLTAVCILYHNDCELPEERAELYEKFINNLIFKRFDPKEEAELISHQQQENKFEEIVQKCGLLKEDDHAYIFWHLSFQEFLTARHLYTLTAHKEEAIVAYWDNSDYREVIRLFIGFIYYNNDLPSALFVVESRLKRDDHSPFTGWLLASQGLLDIPQRHREQPVLLTRAAEKLQAIYKSESNPEIKADAGKLLGRLGDPRWEDGELRAFVRIETGVYDLKGLGRFEIEETKEVWIGKYPVTNVWYREFIEAGGYRKENLEKYWTPEGKKWLISEKIEYPLYWHERKWHCPNAPVVGVSWYEAVAFCSWLTEKEKNGFVYRLLSEWEWQAAAAGFEGREYPWGPEESNEIKRHYYQKIEKTESQREQPWESFAGDEIRCNYESKIGKTSAVGIFELGKTPVTEIYDLGGNVWEWCADWYTKGGSRVLRGGGWSYFAQYVRSAFRVRRVPGYRYRNMGFRLARGQEKQEPAGENQEN